jgi:Protein of unknown function (DUF3176)
VFKDSVEDKFTKADVTLSSTQLSLFLADWFWELSTWLLGTIVEGIMLVLLLHYSDQRLSSWHLKIQIQTVIAVLSQISQSALLISIASCIGQAKWFLMRQKQSTIKIQRYDYASRGPEGALRLLLYGFWTNKNKTIGFQS